MKSAPHPTDPERPLPVGVVGTGKMGSIHAQVYSRLKSCELVGVFDLVPDRAQKLAKKTRCEAFSSLDDLASKVQAVSVAVSTRAHLEVARQLIDRGIPVLVEKPLAASVADARLLVNLAEEKGVQLMVGHTERFNPIIRSIGSLIKKPGFAEVHRLAPFTERGTDVDVILDLMIHDLDLILHFVDSEVAQVDAIGVPVITERYDIANARIRFESGTVANLTASRVSLERMRKVRFFQPDLYISLDTARRSARAYRLVSEPGSKMPKVKALDLGKPPKQDPVDAELESFVDSVRTGSAPAVPGVQGLRAMELAERVREAIERDGRLGRK